MADNKPPPDDTSSDSQRRSSTRRAVSGVDRERKAADKASARAQRITKGVGRGTSAKPKGTRQRNVGIGHRRGRAAGKSTKSGETSSSPTGGIQVFRNEVHKGIAAGLLRHIQGLSRPDTATEMEEPAVYLDGDPEAARRALADAVKAREGMKGRKPQGCVELVFAGPPRYGSPDEWSLDREMEWAHDLLAWSKKTLGANSVIAAAYLHRDESSPHVHILATVVTDSGKLGWWARVAELGEQLGARSKHVSMCLSAIQDDLFQDVSSRYGFDRGQRKHESKHKRQHREIDRAKALENRKHRAKIATLKTLDQAYVEEEETRVQAQENRRQALEAALAVENMEQVGKALSTQLEEQEKVLDGLRRQEADIRSSAQAEVARREQAREAARAAEEERVKARKEFEEFEQATRRKTDELGVLHDDIAARKTEREALRKAIEDDTRQARTWRSAADKARIELGTAMADLGGAKEALATTRGELAKTTEALRKAREQREADESLGGIGGLRSKRGRKMRQAFESTIAEQSTQLAKQSEKSQSLETQVVALETELETTRKARDAFESQVSEVRKTAGRELEDEKAAGQKRLDDAKAASDEKLQEVKEKHKVEMAESARTREAAVLYSLELQSQADWVKQQWDNLEVRLDEAREEGAKRFGVAVRFVLEKAAPNVIRSPVVNHLLAGVFSGSFIGSVADIAAPAPKTTDSPAKGTPRPRGPSAPER